MSCTHLKNHFFFQIVSRKITLLKSKFQDGSMTILNQIKTNDLS